MPDQAPAGRGCGWLALIACFVVMLALVSDGPPASTRSPRPARERVPARSPSESRPRVEPTPAAEPRLQPGDRGRFVQDGYFSLSVEAHDTLIEAVTAGDSYGVAELLVSGKMLMLDKGTAVLVLDTEGWITVRYKVRVTDGQHTGRVGWVARGFLEKQ